MPKTNNNNNTKTNDYKIKSIKITDRIYNEILNMYSNMIVEVKDLSSYAEIENLYQNKYSKIYVDGEYCLIYNVYLLNVLDELGFNEEVENFYESGCKSWKLTLCRKTFQMDDRIETFKEDIGGSYAKAYINKILKRKGLTNEDIVNRLNSFQAEYNEEMAQFHYMNIPSDTNEIYKFTNCIYIDINKAHSDALAEIFPEIKDDLIKLAARAKKEPKYKMIPNYYVGMLAFKTAEQRMLRLNGQFELTYNWIVQRTTKILKAKLNEMFDYSKTIIVYGNTDGVIICNPSKFIESSSNFGEFKVEYTGDVYTMHAKGGWIVQYGDEIKSNIRKSFRDNIDLRIGNSIEVLNSKDYNNIENIKITDYVKEID